MRRATQSLRSEKIPKYCCHIIAQTDLSYRPCHCSLPFYLCGQERIIPSDVIQAHPFISKFDCFIRSTLNKILVIQIQCLDSIFRIMLFLFRQRRSDDHITLRQANGKPTFTDIERIDKPHLVTLDLICAFACQSIIGPFISQFPILTLWKKMIQRAPDDRNTRISTDAAVATSQIRMHSSPISRERSAMRAASFEERASRLPDAPIEALWLGLGFNRNQSSTPYRSAKLIQRGQNSSSSGSDMRSCSEISRIASRSTSL